MSIEWLQELERAVETGTELFACPSVGRDQWTVARSRAELRKVARRAAGNTRAPVQIVRLIPPAEVTPGELFLVPTSVEKPGPRGEPQVRWSVVETKDAAELVRDVRHGSSPYFGMQAEET